MEIETTTADSDDSWIANALKANPPPDSLPNGWIVRSSRSQPGYFFYYNQETGEARWEKPVQAKAMDVAPSRASAPDTSPNHAERPTPKAVPLTSTSATKREAPEAVSTSATEPDAKKSKRSAAEPKEVRVLHILKKHKGSRRPSSWRNPNITSTLEEAREELQGLVDVLQEVKDNPEEMRATFEELARTESDCSSAKRGGDLGFFGRKKMQPSFEQASFALDVGGMSDVVESASGVHVILRIG
ncbi:PPIC-type PPIASE domain [Fragilaria crotonensis]|nr:PPIC-type PPIASE domain [Fragilaria crotonensis]